MITEQHTKEILSRAFLLAIAGRAGFNVHKGELDYGVDYIVASVRYSAARSRYIEDGPNIHLQLKATVDWEIDGDRIVYDLEAKTWNDMVERDVTRPLYLGLLCLEPDMDKWLVCSEERMVLQNCLYWYDATGQAPTPNTTTRRTRIPRANLLTSDSLVALMDANRAAVRAHR
ncbi:DUF4365 domain-containing protein [Lichenibacterium minor]|uniref:DUF4365 domain-containing protein n=1 Tax=Lichenibacterium minor TaxID=2316528 RepID=UPI0013EA88B8|nr:DUF4365 domain-containing protein [Lichenibacterium minor]